jgi:hypothetical protein
VEKIAMFVFNCETPQLTQIGQIARQLNGAAQDLAGFTIASWFAARAVWPYPGQG